MGSFSTQNRMFMQQDLSVSTEENLRVGMGALIDALRNGAYGVPTTNVPSWIPWVAGFTSNPQISATAPATISVAACSSQPVATFTAHADSGATTLDIASAVAGSPLSDLLNTSTKSLVLINDSENAIVRSVSTSSIQIDTDPLTKGNQGLGRGYPQGTPLCRVDVLTFSIQTDSATGLPWLGLDLNQGGGVQNVADGVSNLTVTAVTAGTQYKIALTARSQNLDRVTGTYLPRTLTSNVTIKK
jgi:hypothetical protein